MPATPSDLHSPDAETTAAQASVIDALVENSPVAVENLSNGHIANGATPKKPRRRKNERDDVTQKRIDDVYDAMDAFKKKVMDNPAAKYRRDEKATSEIEQMLSVAPAPSPKYLNLVAYDMWNQKDSKTGEQFWRDKMSPYNIAHQYETRIMKLLAGNGHAKDPDEDKTPVLSVSGKKKVVVSQEWLAATGGK